MRPTQSNRKKDTGVMCQSKIKYNTILYAPGLRMGLVSIFVRTIMSVYPHKTLLSRVTSRSTPFPNRITDLDFVVQLPVPSRVSDDVRLTFEHVFPCAGSSSTKSPIEGKSYGLTCSSTWKVAGPKNRREQDNNSSGKNMVARKYLSLFPYLIPFP
jgi:hypothetical protein